MQSKLAMVAQPSFLEIYYCSAEEQRAPTLESIKLTNEQLESLT